MIPAHRHAIPIDSMAAKNDDVWLDIAEPTDFDALAHGPHEAAKSLTRVLSPSSTTCALAIFASGMIRMFSPTALSLALTFSPIRLRQGRCKYPFFLHRCVRAAQAAQVAAPRIEALSFLIKVQFHHSPPRADSREHIESAILGSTQGYVLL